MLSVYHHPIVLQQITKHLSIGGGTVGRLKTSSVEIEPPFFIFTNHSFIHSFTHPLILSFICPLFCYLYIPLYLFIFIFYLYFIYLFIYFHLLSLIIQTRWQKSLKVKISIPGLNYSEARKS